jgi:hypothetical protein
VARAGLASTLSTATALLALLAAAGGVLPIAVLMLLSSVGFGLQARHWA